MKQTTTGIKLDDTLRERLRALGSARDRSPHWLIKTALVEFLDREEAYEHERQDDEARWQHFQLTGNTLSQEQAFAFFGRLRQGEAGSMSVQEAASDYSAVVSRSVVVNRDKAIANPDKPATPKRRK